MKNRASFPRKESGLGESGKSIFMILWVVLVLGYAASEGFTADGLFTSAGTAQVPILQAGAILDTTVMKSRVVRVNWDVLKGDQSPKGAESILLNLFDGVSFQASRDRLEERSSTRYTWFGRIVGATISQVVLVVEDGFMAGNILADGEMYQIRALEGGIHVIRKIDQASFPEEAPPIPAADTSGQTQSAPSASQAADDGSVIDVMVVYTPAVANHFSNNLANIMANIQLGIDETNQSYANSGVIQTVRLVHAAQVSYAETGKGSTDLSRLQNPSDGYMDEVHPMRDTFGADLVSLWVESLDACGIGYLMTNASTAFASYGFSVVSRSCATSGYSFSHEMGHNMGAAHDRYVNDGSGAYSYSHGYVYVPGKWRTVMAYNSQCSDQGISCTRIPYWSNPNVTYQQIPTGISERAWDSANNALTLNNTAYVVANFRASVVPFQRPDLTPFQPSGWSDKIVASKSMGTNIDSMLLYPTDTVYVDWAVINDGSVATSSGFYTALYVDDVLKNTWFTDPPLNPGSYVDVEDYPIGSLSAGTHTIKIVADSTGVIDETSEGNNSYTKTVSVQPQCSYSLSPTSATSGQGASSGSVNVTTGAGCPWTASTNAVSWDWLGIGSGWSGTGSGTVTWYVLANNEMSLRSGYLTIAGQPFTVTQQGKCVYSISPSSNDAGSGAGSGSVSVIAGSGCPWSAATNPASWDWLGVSSGASGSGNGTVNYVVLANNAGSPRIGTLAIAGQTFTITQQAGGCVFSISPTSKTFTSSSGSDSVNVTSLTGCPWTASTNSGSWDWIGISSGASGNGNGTVSYFVLANNTGGTRAGTLTIAGQTFPITQQAGGCSYSISPIGAAFGKEGGTGSVNVTNSNGCSWSASTNSGSWDWIGISSGTTGTGNGTVNYLVLPNNTGGSRTGTLTIANQTFTITQGVQ